MDIIFAFCAGFYTAFGIALHNREGVPVYWCVQWPRFLSYLWNRGAIYIADNLHDAMESCVAAAYRVVIFNADDPSLTMLRAAVEDFHRALNNRDMGWRHGKDG